MFGKRRREANAFYDEEIRRFRQKLTELPKGSQEYKEVRAELQAVVNLRESDYESTRRISKSDKGSIVRTACGIGGSLLLGYGVSKFEADGHIFTGQKKNLISTLINMVKNFGIFSKS